MKNILQNLSKSLVLLAIVGTLGLSTTAMAHETPCPYCKLKVVQNTKDMDNEVTVKVGNKRIEYRCVYCVIKDQKKYSGDLGALVETTLVEEGAGQQLAGTQVPAAFRRIA